MPDEQNLNNQITDDQQPLLVGVDVDQLKSDLETAKQEAEANLNGWKRAAADLKNFQDQQEKKSSELVEFAREVAVAKLLPSLDSLEQALIHSPPLPGAGLNYESSNKSEIRNPKSETNSNVQIPNDTSASPNSQLVNSLTHNWFLQYQTWLAGIESLAKQLDKALSELGVQKIEALGKRFDPSVHEAIREVESDEEEGTVVEEYMTGYTINGKIVRPSQVGISKKL